MKKLRSTLLSAMVGVLLVSSVIAATTPGTVRLTGTISDYTGGSNNSTSHFTVAWVTKADGHSSKPCGNKDRISDKEWGDHTPTYKFPRGKHCSRRILRRHGHHVRGTSGQSGRRDMELPRCGWQHDAGW